jgi:glycosyltransferase involved in cell wall biosynthesis
MDKIMKKILFITSRLPYPPIGGDRLKNYWVLNILSKYFKIHLVSITESEVPEEFYEWANKIGITYKIFKKSRVRSYFNAFKGLFKNLPLQVSYYYFDEIQEYIDLIYKDYDLIFSTLIRTAEYVIDKNKPKILDMADSIGLNYLKSYKKSHSIFWKVIYYIESNRLLKFENLCIDKFNKTLFFNREEEKYFNKPLKTVWIPHGVNENLLNYKNTNDKYKNWVVFFGKMDYQPNIDAVMLFVKNVLPKLNENIKFVIVGAYPTKNILELNKKYENVEITGFVDDPYIILKSALCVVAPMQTGGGIQNKILETMALGTVNIVSLLAAKPIGGENMKDFIIEDNPLKIAAIINDIYNNPHKYDDIKKSAREYIKNNFTWTIYEQNLSNIIDSILNQK